MVELTLAQERDDLPLEEHKPCFMLCFVGFVVACFVLFLHVTRLNYFITLERRRPDIFFFSWCSQYSPFRDCHISTAILWLDTMAVDRYSRYLDQTKHNF